jgi:hypothetical protein
VRLTVDELEDPENLAFPRGQRKPNHTTRTIVKTQVKTLIVVQRTIYWELVDIVNDDHLAT